MPGNQQQEQQQESVVKKTGKKLLRDRALKLGKKGGKVAAKLLSKGVLALGKTVVGILAGIGLPALLVIVGIVLIVFFIYLGTTFFFIGAPEELDTDGQALIEHIHKAAANTVDQSKPEQIPHAVEPEILIAAMQIYDSDSSVTTEDAVSELAEAMKPIFEYEKFEGVTILETTNCSEGDCTTTTSTEKWKRNELVRVDKWDSVVTITVDYVEIDEIVSSTATMVDDKAVVTTVRRLGNDIITSMSTTYDYTLFERVLSEKPFEYGEESKKTVEAVYELNGFDIYYTEWLEGKSVIDFGGDYTVIPGGSIPIEFMEIYLAAEKKYSVPWYYLAAFHYVETKFSTHKPMISSVGAEGHMQFMPCTWLGWNFPGCKGGKGFVNVPDSIKHNPSQIKRYGGEGIDGNGDGKADPFDIWDAIFSAASYLNKQGFSKNQNKAIRAYNHSDKYVADINNFAQKFKDEAQYMPGDGEIPKLAPGSFMRPSVGIFTSGFGGRWGAFHAGVDIADPSRPPIVAVADGTVIRSHTGCPPIGYYGSKCGYGWGNFVIVRHTVQGKIYDAVYAHFHRLDVREGQSVEQGQYLGVMGMSGSSTGIHLHFELHPGGRSGQGTAVNPALYIPL